jgi:hypothetical protein
MEKNTKEEPLVLKVRESDLLPISIEGIFKPSNWPRFS